MSTPRNSYFSREPQGRPSVRARARNVIMAYRTAYYELYGREADKCIYMGRNWYSINGIPRQLPWIVDETERLRQKAEEQARQEKKSSDRLNILSLIRKISGL